MGEGKTCPPCRLLVMVGVAGELAEELELLLEEIFVKMCKKITIRNILYHHNFSEWKKNYL